LLFRYCYQTCLPCSLCLVTLKHVRLPKFFFKISSIFGSIFRVNHFLGIGSSFACNFQNFWRGKHGSSLSTLVTREVFSFIRYSLYFLFFPCIFQLLLVCFRKNTRKASRFLSLLSGGGKIWKLYQSTNTKFLSLCKELLIYMNQFYKSHAIDEWN
jgi:hypothetical protein